MGVTSANFNPSRNSLLLKVLLKSFCGISEQHFLLSFRIFGGIFFKSISFAGVKRSEFFSMSDKEASLKENALLFATLLCINKMLGWFLNLPFALFTGSVMSLLLSAMYVFSFITRFLVAFF